MNLPYFITFLVQGSKTSRNVKCRTKLHAQHIIKEINNYTLSSFNTNCKNLDISQLQIIK